MTKILFFIPNLKHGGAEKVLVNLVNNLDKTKYDVTLSSIFDEGVNKEFLNNDVKYEFKFNKVFRGNSQLMKLFPPKFLYNFFIKEDYDILISFLEGPAARIISGCTNIKTKKIAWIHSEFINEEVANVGYRNSREAKNSYQKFSVIVGVSKNVIHSFDKILSVNIPLKVLYNVNETEEIKIKGQGLVASFFNKDLVQICSVGKIIKVKGFDRLLEAHRRLLDEGFLHEINILGIGEDQIQLEKRVKVLGLESSFKFLGFHKNPYKYMSKCDLYVCSSTREGFSTAVSEALILGLPVVSTNCSGSHELLGDQNEYGIVTENSIDGLHQGIKEMLANPEKLEFYTKQAKTRGGFFSKENTVKAVENLLDELL